MIILQCAETGNQRGIRFNPNGGGSWRKITREGRKNMSLKEWLDDMAQIKVGIAILAVVGALGGA